MRLAQRLYEMGHITYMRTDSPSLSKSATEIARTRAVAEYGNGCVLPPGGGPAQRKKNKAAAGAQEAHEAIRPAAVDGGFASPKSLAGVLSSESDSRMLSLYELIYRRTLASVMAPAVSDATSVVVVAGL